MGYSFYLISKDKDFTKDDLVKSMSMLSEFNRKGFVGRPPCDLSFHTNYINVSGSFSMSGKYVEGFILNLMMVLLELDYKPKVLSHDWKYGTEEDWKWLDTNRNYKEIEIK